MFSKSSLLAIALGVAAIASTSAPASALSSQVYSGQHLGQPILQGGVPGIYGNFPKTVGRSEYPMPRRPMRQPFN